MGEHGRDTRAPLRATLRRLRAGIYDALIAGMTAGWYRAVLQRLPKGARVLDVGIGTGAALLANARDVERQDLRITGIDIDAAYIERCRAAIDRAQLGAYVGAHRESVYDHAAGPYDAIYFSGSFMLLPDPVAALRHVAALLGHDGRIYFTQTLEQRRSPLLEVVKPWLRHVTTIDFGRVTYEDDLRHVLTAAGIELVERHTLHAGRRRTAMLLVARPSPLRRA